MIRYIGAGDDVIHVYHLDLHRHDVITGHHHEVKSGTVTTTCSACGVLVLRWSQFATQGPQLQDRLLWVGELRRRMDQAGWLSVDTSQSWL